MNITRRAVALGLAAALLQALMLVAFAWPAVNLAPRDLPVAVAELQLILRASSVGCVDASRARFADWSGATA